MTRSKAQQKQERKKKLRIRIRVYRANISHQTKKGSVQIGESVQSRWQHFFSSPAKNAIHWFIGIQNRLPKLQKLALRSLTIPATSAPIGRVFSCSGFFMRSERSTLSTAMLEKIIFEMQRVTCCILPFVCKYICM